MPRAAGGGPFLHLPLPEVPEEPLHRRLYRALRDALLEGRLAAGARLPSTRTLSGELGLSRNTVLAAYEQLTAEGYLTGRSGGGTRVADGVAPMARPPAANNVVRPRLSRAARRLAGLTGPLTLLAGDVRAFRPGLPALDLFPAAAWARASSRWWRRHGDGDPGDAGGLAVLREAIADSLRASRGIRCAAGEVIVVAGSQQALDLAARVLVDPGDTAWVEEPGYPGVRWALTAAGARTVPVPVDAEGLRIDDGVRRAPRPRLVHVTPSHQFPLGGALTATRRLALLEVAARTRAWIVEDDYDGEFRFTHRPLAALQALDPSRVLYVGSFSKVLTPSLRLGYLVAPPSLVPALLAARRATDLHPPGPTQGALAEFMLSGQLERHVRRMREVYRERHEVLVEEARVRLAGRLEVAPTDTGLHVVGWLPDGFSDREAQARAARAGVDVLPLSRFGRVPGGRSGLLLGYGGCPPDLVRRGVAALARALEKAG